MNLKGLREEIEWCIKEGDETALMWIKKTVEAVCNTGGWIMTWATCDKDVGEWLKIKELLEIE